MENQEKISFVNLIKTVEANQKLQHNMSAIHQILNSEAKVLERYLKHYGIVGNY